MCFALQRRALFRHINLQKWSEHVGAFNILTWKCASRHNGVHFFDIWTSKSGLNMVFFVHFDLEMCFAPQGRALFRHLNVKKWFEHGVFCTFWLGNVLRATTACTFSTSERQKVVWTWCFLCILTWKCATRHKGVHFFDISTSKSGPGPSDFYTFDVEMCFASLRCAFFRHLNFQKCVCTFCMTWKCASRHNGVQLLISHLTTWLRTCRFSKPTFRSSGATNYWKNIVNRDFTTFSRTCIFFLLSLSLLWSSHFFSSLPWLFPPLLFHMSILAEIWLLNFLRSPILVELNIVGPWNGCFLTWR